MTTEAQARETSRTGSYTRARLETGREELVTDSPERLLDSSVGYFPSTHPPWSSPSPMLGHGV